MRRIHELKLADIELFAFSDGTYFVARTDKDGNDQSLVGRLDSPAKRAFVAGMDNNGPDCRHKLCLCDQALIFFMRLGISGYITDQSPTLRKVPLGSGC